MPSDTSIPTFMPSLHALGFYPYSYFITNPLIIQKVPLPVYISNILFLFNMFTAINKRCRWCILSQINNQLYNLMYF